MEETIDYIKSFLVYDSTDAAKRIGYTRDEEEWNKYALVIVPGKNVLSGEKKNWDIPDFTISPRAERLQAYTDEMGETTGGTWVIREDIIYNTAFLLSQAELLLDLKRDEEGRLECCESVLGKQGLTTIPVLDEYARLCSKLVEAPLPQPKMRKIYLTHDVDEMYSYRSFRGFFRGLQEGKILRAISSLLDYHNDPAFTFPWLHAKDRRVSGAEEIVFLKSTPGRGHDNPQYAFRGEDFARVMRFLIHRGIPVGWQSSFYSHEEGYSQSLYDKLHEAYDREMNLINADGVARRQRYEAQKKKFEAAMSEWENADGSAAPITSPDDSPELSTVSATIGKQQTREEKDQLRQERRDKRYRTFEKDDKRYHRAHGLRIVSPEDLLQLEAMGITDDFSLGWTDQIGFRLGTTRSARFIDPATLRLTNLTLHPLNIVDYTLTDLRYMEIQDEGTAYYTCTQLIDKVKQHGGELCLLWHNTSIGNGSYHSQLYKEILAYIGL